MNDNSEDALRKLEKMETIQEVFSELRGEATGLLVDIDFDESQENYIIQIGVSTRDRTLDEIKKILDTNAEDYCAKLISKLQQRNLKVKLQKEISIASLTADTEDLIIKPKEYKADGNIINLGDPNIRYQVESSLEKYSAISMHKVIVNFAD